MMRVLTAPHRAWRSVETLSVDQVVEDLADALAFVRRVAIADQELELDQPVVFGLQPRRDAAVIRVLAEATANFVPVRWTLKGELPWSLRSVIHLYPPSSEDYQLEQTWAAHFVFGLCSYRVGPDFLVIQDIRPGGVKTRVTVPAEWMPAFVAVAERVIISQDEHEKFMFNQLVEQGLALRLSSEHGVVLPYHARRWPIPGRDGAVTRTAYLD
jgi:hypothetical protein